MIIASQTAGFYKIYPFYKLANRSAFDFWAWQAIYAVQFLSLEFFFRGFILKAIAPRLGSAAIFVMVVPYCMIHFGKPMPETLGAIIAGTVLGSALAMTASNEASGQGCASIAPCRATGRRWRSTPTMSPRSTALASAS